MVARPKLKKSPRCLSGWRRRCGRQATPSALLISCSAGRSWIRSCRSNPAGIVRFAQLQALEPYEAFVIPILKQLHLAIDKGCSIDQGGFVPVQNPSSPKAQRTHRARGLTAEDFRRAQPRLSGESSISDKIQRNEALVIRSGGSISGPAAVRRRRAEAEAKEQERQRLLREQLRELRRLQWFQARRIDVPDAPEDLMRRALQGGAPRLKK